MPNPIFSNSGVFAEQDLLIHFGDPNHIHLGDLYHIHLLNSKEESVDTHNRFASPARKEFSKTSAGEKPLSGMIEPVRRPLIFGSRLLIW